MIHMLPPVDSAVLDLRVDGPDAPAIPEFQLRRLFPGPALTASRRERLRTWPRVVVSEGARTVGVATCRQTDREMRVPDLAAVAPVTAPPGAEDGRVLDRTLDTIELMSLAGGCYRIRVHAPAVLASLLAARGYAPVGEPCGGGWFQKLIA